MLETSVPSGALTTMLEGGDWIRPRFRTGTEKVRISPEMAVNPIDETSVTSSPVDGRSL
jgi:hypothetical protein